ncbi:hypothetical protein NFJ02_12g12000 [Pycnococcus provasolii]
MSSSASSPLMTRAWNASVSASLSMPESRIRLLDERSQLTERDGLEQPQIYDRPVYPARRGGPPYAGGGEERGGFALGVQVLMQRAGGMEAEHKARR